MTKKLLLINKALYLLGFIVLLHYTNAQSHTILYEKFNTNDGNCNSTTNARETGSSSSNANPIVSNSSYCSINSYSNYSDNSFTRLTTPHYYTIGYKNSLS